MVRKITDVETYDTLCNNNNWAQYKLKHLRKLCRGNKEEIQLVNECLDILRFMKVQGQHMENRLKKYVQAITDLGFQRQKKSNT